MPATRSFAYQGVPGWRAANQRTRVSLLRWRARCLRLESSSIAEATPDAQLESRAPPDASGSAVGGNFSNDTVNPKSIATKPMISQSRASAKLLRAAYSVRE